MSDINTLSEDEQLLKIYANPRTILHILNPSEKLQRVAVALDGNCIKYIQKPSEKLKRLALAENGEALTYIDYPSFSLQLTALAEQPEALRHIHPQNDLVVDCALHLDPEALVWVNEPTDAQQDTAIELRGSVIAIVPDPTPEQQVRAIRSAYEHPTKGAHITVPDTERALYSRLDQFTAIAGIKKPTEEAQRLSLTIGQTGSDVNIETLLFHLTKYSQALLAELDKHLILFLETYGIDEPVKDMTQLGQYVNAWHQLKNAQVQRDEVLPPDISMTRP